MLRQLLLALLLTGTLSLSAQTNEERAKEDLDYYNGNRPAQQADMGLRDRIWFGTGGQLQFQGGNLSSAFTIGLSPMAGYKVNNFLSFGPRGSILYNALRFENGTPDPDKFNFITWEAGLFARAKVFNPFFAHVEYSIINEADRIQANEVVRITRAIPYAGAGISQGGGPGAIGFEILVLFRLSSADRLNDSPVQFRTGLNYNF